MLCVFVRRSRSVNEIDAGVDAASCQSDVTLLEARLVTRVIERVFQGRALDAIRRARVAVVEPPGVQVAGRNHDASFLVEVDGELMSAKVNACDPTGAAVLHKVPAVADEATIVAPCDDPFADSKLPITRSESLAGDHVVLDESGARPLVERDPHA